MAERRMFAKTIIDSDAFLDMPQSSQLLYFHLCMRADDEGFINNPKSIMRNVGAKEDDLKLLFAKKFVIPFESGVVVIKHWKIHNYIRGDRLHGTKYVEEKSQLGVDEKGGYTLCQSNDCQLVDTLDTEVRLGKVRLGKDSIDKSNRTKKFVPPTLDEVTSYIEQNNLNVDALQFFNYFEEGGWVDSKGNKVKSWKQKLLTWNKFDTGKRNFKTEAIPEYNDSQNPEFDESLLEEIKRNRNDNTFS